ncbi:hypothetical protein H4S14_002017 [Agrobacterium vitis]|nr:hypothetical protein [Agrobacterium vitis]MBE1438272.1 hypothetical protein [Agrobacterium vitis]
MMKGLPFCSGLCRPSLVSQRATIGGMAVQRAKTYRAFQILLIMFCNVYSLLTIIVFSGLTKALGRATEKITAGMKLTNVTGTKSGLSLPIP